jgi:ribonuclease VapC
MFLDASALTAILAPEEDGEALADRLAGVEHCLVSALAIWETTVALARIRQSPIEVAKTLVDEFLAEIGAEILPIDTAIGAIALDAFARFGKGRHPAALNMGDCFAYACAKAQGQPLLCKGDDFARTDIRRA